MVQHDIYIGKVIGNYRIEQEIAKGSFGTVYLARNLHIEEHTVAIKILHAVHLGSEKEKTQFFQEARILLMLKGLENILSLLDFGVDGNIPYMIAEYEERGSLLMLMEQHNGPLPLQEALQIIQQVGHGLQAAHDKGIVHRDLKPENILFDIKGEALLADFGISTVLSTVSVKHTHVAGTPAYMAPEQFRGQICKESDQYALACIAYELLTGRKLFAAQDFLSMGFLHTTEAPALPRQFNPHIPLYVERVLLKALSKERTKRYPSVSAFVAALSDQTSAENVDDVDEQVDKQEISPTPVPIELHTTTPLSKPGAPKQTKTSSPHHNRPAIIAVISIIVILLLLGGWAISTAILQTTLSPPATITITPATRTVQDTYSMQGVTSNADPAKHQVTMRQLSSTKSDTISVALTHFHQDPHSATGNITFTNDSPIVQTVVLGTVFTVGAIDIITDQKAVIPAATAGSAGQTTVSAHAIQGGTAGNISASAIDQLCCDPGNHIRAKNQDAFSGGMDDAADYNYLKQEDVDATVNAEQGDAQKDIQNQMKAGEQLLGDMNCDDPYVREDIPPNAHVPNDVKTANIIMRMSCSAEVFDTTTVQNLLKQKALKDPGTEYVLAGHISVQAQQPQVQPDGSITFSSVTKGIWCYNWTDTKDQQILRDRQNLLNQIKGTSKTQALHILNSNYTGISNATIAIDNGGATLPSDINQIKLVVNTVQGL